jgi:hypothetical protein
MADSDNACSWRGALKTINSDLASNEKVGEKIGMSIGDKGGPWVGVPAGAIVGATIGPVAGAEYGGADGYQRLGTIGAIAEGTVGVVVGEIAGVTTGPILGIIAPAKVTRDLGEEIGYVVGAAKGPVDAAANCIKQSVTPARHSIKPSKQFGP